MTTPTKLEAAVERLKTDAQDELDAHAEWLAENPDEQDPGPEGIDASPRTLLAILHALAAANERARNVEAALAASEARRGELEKALDPFGRISSEGVIKKETGHVTITTCAEYFHRAAALNPQQEGSRDHDR